MSEVIDLRKKLGTPYVWNGFSKILKEILAEAVTNNQCIDIATCRFGPDCIFQIEQAINNGLPEIINSEEPLLDEILQHNKRLGAISRGDEIPSTIRKRIWLDFSDSGDKSVKALLTAIKESDTNVIWYADASQKGYSENYNIVMAVLNMQFPKRMFDVSSSQRLASVFEVYHSVLSVSDLLDTDEFWYNMGGNYAIMCKCGANNIVNLPGIKRFSKQEFATSPNVIPYWIGTESISNSEHRKGIRNKLIAQIRTESIINRSEQSKSILGLIKQYGESEV